MSYPNANSRDFSETRKLQSEIVRAALTGTATTPVDFRIVSNNNGGGSGSAEEDTVRQRSVSSVLMGTRVELTVKGGAAVVLFDVEPAIDGPERLKSLRWLPATPENATGFGPLVRLHALLAAYTENEISPSVRCTYAFAAVSDEFGKVTTIHFASEAWPDSGGGDGLSDWLLPRRQQPTEEHHSSVFAQCAVALAVVSADAACTDVGRGIRIVREPEATPRRFFSYSAGGSSVDCSEGRLAVPLLGWRALLWPSTSPGRDVWKVSGSDDDDRRPLEDGLPYRRSMDALSDLFGRSSRAVFRECDVFRDASRIVSAGEKATTSENVGECLPVTYLLPRILADRQKLECGLNLAPEKKESSVLLLTPRPELSGTQFRPPSALVLVPEEEEENIIPIVTAAVEAAEKARAEATRARADYEAERLRASRRARRKREVATRYEETRARVQETKRAALAAEAFGFAVQPYGKLKLSSSSPPPPGEVIGARGLAMLFAWLDTVVPWGRWPGSLNEFLRQISFSSSASLPPIESDSVSELATAWDSRTPVTPALAAKLLGERAQLTEFIRDVTARGG